MTNTSTMSSNPAAGALLRTGTGSLLADGTRTLADGSRWVDDACAVDRRALRRATGPVLDIGCGPGRHAAELTARGVVSLGIDITPAAVELARARGARVLERSVFDHVPGAGRWTTALLFDGNIGIGGDPTRLLGRVHQLLRPGGSTIVEVAGAGGCRSARYVSFEIDGSEGPGFWFAGVCVDCIAGVAESAAFSVAEVWHDSGRSFAHLERLTPPDTAASCN